MDADMKAGTHAVELSPRAVPVDSATGHIEVTSAAAAPDAPRPPPALRRWDPRLHVAAAIGWSVFLLVTLAALVTANLAAAEAESRARADAEGLLTEFATQVRDALAMHLETRRSLLQATAAQIQVSSDRSTVMLRHHLDAVQEQFREFAWLGAFDGRGRLLDAAGVPPTPMTDVPSEPWFRQGRVGPYVSDVQETIAPPPAGDAAASHARVIHVSTPLQQAGGAAGGVLVGDLSWSWILGLLGRMQQALDPQRQLEVLLADGDNRVLAGPASWAGRTLSPDTDLTQGGRYLVGSQAHRRVADGVGLGWTTIVRQRADMALAPVIATRRTVFLIVFLAGLLSAAATLPVTRLLLRRLGALAREAEAVRQGTQSALAVPGGADEVSRIGATLAQVVDHLQREKQALQTLNTELDSRVAERTLRIARMADEARQAAVTRERLRLARDLHDTLAHSLMALLTQIRLVRKLRTRMQPAELDAELGRAEEVAAIGLTEARAAILQMRAHGVRDAGLGPALAVLLDKLRERTGVTATLQADARAAELAGERAETAFRIAEEALYNVERHAEAQVVDVQLRWMPAPPAGAADLAGAAARVRLSIADDGIGFDPRLPRPGHYGLLGIQEQATLLEARLALDSHPGKGTRIELEFDA